MKSFSELNRKKLPFIFMVVSAIMMLFILLVLLIVALVNDDYPDLEGFIIIILVTGTVMPVFMIAIGYLGWHINRIIRQRTLQKSPFNELTKIGFTSSYIDEDSRIAFTEETQEIKLNGYRIQFNISKDTPKTAEFTAFVHTEPLEKAVYNRLKDQFKEEDIYFDFDGLVKKYKLKKASNLTIDQLRDDLIRFVEKLKDAGFEPQIPSE